MNTIYFRVFIRILFLAMVITTILTSPCQALVNFSGKYLRADLVLSQRLSGAWLDFPEYQYFQNLGDDNLGASITRILIDGVIGDSVSFEANIYADLAKMPDTRSSQIMGGAAVLSSPYRTPFLSHRFWERENFQGEVGIDRLAIFWNQNPWTLSLGRFTVNYSVTSIFTPNDFFAPFSVAAVNKVYKPGVDAARIVLELGTLSSLGRGSTVVEDIHLALMGGRLAQRWIMGGSIQGESGPVNIRTEGHAGRSDSNPKETFVHLAAGLDTTFNWQNSGVGMEYAFFSDRAKNSADYLDEAFHLLPDQGLFLARHYLGFWGGLDLSALARLNNSWIVNLIDRSGLVTVMLIYSLGDELELVAGALTSWGKTGPVNSLNRVVNQISALAYSEYGYMPRMLFLEIRTYF